MMNFVKLKMMSFTDKQKDDLHNFKGKIPNLK